MLKWWTFVRVWFCDWAGVLEELCSEKNGKERQENFYHILAKSLLGFQANVESWLYIYYAFDDFMRVKAYKLWEPCSLKLSLPI